MKCCDVRTKSLKQYHKECMKNMHANKTHFHKKGFALVLVLKVRVFGSRKWHILVLGVVKIFCTCILDNLLYAALLSNLWRHLKATIIKNRSSFCATITETKKFKIFKTVALENLLYIRCILDKT